MDETPDAADHARPADRARPTAGDRQRAWQSIIDRAIEDAAARGAFDNLPGRGKPLVWETEADDEMWLAHHMLKGQGFQPAWVERLRAIDAEIAAIHERVDAFVTAFSGPPPPGLGGPRAVARRAVQPRLTAELHERIAAVNRLIDAHNLDVAAVAAPRRRLVAADVVADLEARVGGGGIPRA